MRIGLGGLSQETFAIRILLGEGLLTEPCRCQALSLCLAPVGLLPGYLEMMGRYMKAGVLVTVGVMLGSSV